MLPPQLVEIICITICSGFYVGHCVFSKWR